jgi:nicotinamidase-related amidase
MTTLDRSGKALLVIDAQVGVVAEAHKRVETLAAINVAISKARAAGIPVIWVQHSDEELVLESPEWQIAPELEPLKTDRKIRKLYPSSFEATELDAVLTELGVGHLIVCGAETNNCVRHTSHSAIERGYDVTLISDAHTTTGFEWGGYVVDAARVIDEQNINFMQKDLPGRTVNALPAANLEF